MNLGAFYHPAQIPDAEIKFAVLVARYQGKWILCSHKQRTTWETPGGHRENGEQIDAAARRELWEETGAAQAELHPICVYSVPKDGKASYGMLYFADVKVLGPLPETSEIGEIQLFDALPANMTYPGVHPQLHSRVQAWLNVQSGAGELWDVYDADRRPTGRLHRRGDPMQPGEYHLVVHAWIQNSREEYLITKRSPNKGFPNMWEWTGGSALAGEDSLTAVLREIREETGLVIQPEQGKLLLQYTREDNHADVWLFQHEFSLDDVHLQEGETCDKMKASRETIYELVKKGKFVPNPRIQEILG